MRLFVLSQPKAGTYLAAGALQHLGFNATNWHVSEDRYEDYTGADKITALVKYKLLSISSPIEKTLSYIDKGQFAVGHLPSNRRCLTALSEFRVIFLVREMRSSLHSFYHFDLKRHPEKGGMSLECWLRKHAGEYVKRVSAMTPWHYPRVRYESMIAAEHRAVKLIAATVSRSDDDVRQAIDFAKSKGSITKSSEPHRLEDLWTQECERQYVAAGGEHVSQKLGYDAPPYYLNREYRRICNKINIAFNTFFSKSK